MREIRKIYHSSFFIIEINIWVITVIINVDKYLKDTLLLLCCSLLYLTAHFKMWNNEDRTSLFQISNHTPIQQLLSNSVAGGGLVFYVYNSINFKILKNLNKSKPNIEKNVNISLYLQVMQVQM